jgi:hypothetical protein
VAQTRSEIAVTKARYAKAKDDARRQAALNLVGVLGVNFHVADWSRSAEQAFREQWLTIIERPYPEGGWDWPEIFRSYRDWDALRIAVWSENRDRLIALGLLRATGNAVIAEFAEGDPRPDCPLKGKRVLIILETAHCYARLLNRPELRLEPANERLAELYRDTYGFTLEQPRQGRPYYRKDV